MVKLNSKYKGNNLSTHDYAFEERKKERQKRDEEYAKSFNLKLTYENLKEQQK
jgi:hypothetical protein